MMVLFLMHRSARRADGARVDYFTVLNLNHSCLFIRAPLTPDCEPEQIRLSISVNCPG